MGEGGDHPSTRHGFIVHLQSSKTTLYKRGWWATQCSCILLTMHAEITNFAWKKNVVQKGQPYPLPTHGFTTHACY